MNLDTAKTHTFARRRPVHCPLFLVHRSSAQLILSLPARPAAAVGTATSSSCNGRTCRAAVYGGVNDGGRQKIVNGNVCWQVAHIPYIKGGIFSLPENFKAVCKSDMNCCHTAFGLTKKRGLSHSQQHFSSSSSAKNIKDFSYSELKSATDNFHPRNKIGRGGFGTVYKGTLKNGTFIAVKKLSAQSKQGVNEFLTEIDIISNVRHVNLVELIGCCLNGSERILVYEYVENGSLDRVLLGDSSERAKLNWGKRVSICLGTARGLAFLHEDLEPYIVHRDIKASNVLLDSNFMPKIGDFGLAKLFPDNATHISTRVAGTIGYLAPEYAMHGQLTKKADIYSYGVLLLELVSGRSASDISLLEMEKFLLAWAWHLHEEGRLKEIADTTLQEYPEEEVIRYTKVALFCTQAAAQRRPSMAQVVEMLSKPVRLNDKELTPPGIVQVSAGKDRGRRAANSSNLRFKGLSFASSASRFSSAPFSFTELIPR